jgi:L-fuculose-phosphate aldolase
MAYGSTQNGNGRTNGNGNGGNGYGPRPSEFQLKQNMCEIGQRIWLKGFCAGNEGNHSCRISENRILCTPTGISKGSLKPDDICTVDLEGKQISGKRKRTSEILLHLAIYKARPDVNAVVHSHPPHATAFAVAGVDLPTCIHPEAEVFLGAVKTAKYVTPGDKRLGESILPYVKDSNTILLQNHGTVTYAPDLEDAYYKLEIVDAYARILILAKQVGSIRPLDANQMKELLDLKVRFGLEEPRLKDGGKDFTCNTDFISRVGGGDVATRGKMVTPAGVAPVPCGSELRPSTAVQASPMEQAIHQMLPGNFSEADIETLVQTITDQIMASV